VEDIIGMTGLNEKGLGKGGRPVRSPFRMAGLLVLAYLFVVAPYILFSSDIASHVARSISDLQRIETVKGFVFVMATAVGLLAFAWFLFAKIARAETEILLQRAALVIAECKAMAGVFASAVGHDIGNQLMILKESVRRLRKFSTLTSASVEELEGVFRALNDLERLAHRLVTGGRKGMPGEYEKVDLAVLLAHVVDEARHHPLVCRCAIEVIGEKSIELRANPVMIRQLLLNLVLNAAQATNGGGHVRVGALQGQHGAILEVHDDGPGVPPERRNLIFEPFYTTQDTGTGLGLLSVKVYAAAHQGTVEVTDSPLGGALFRVSLPANVPFS
jgi:two-component system, NtrC family, sensor histidine kinase HydH